MAGGVSKHSGQVLITHGAARVNLRRPEERMHARSVDAVVEASMHACRNVTWVCAVLIVGLGTRWTGPVHGAPPPERAAVAQAVNRFGFEVMRWAGQANDNLLVSPYSIATALAMVRAGAQGGP